MEKPRDIPPLAYAPTLHSGSNAREETLRKIEKISMEYHVGFNPNTPEQLEMHLRHHGFEVERLPLKDAEEGFLYATRRP